MPALASPRRRGAARTPPPGAVSQAASLTGFREARCQFNCTLNSIPDVAASKLIKVYGTFKYVADCVALLLPQR